MLKLKKMNMCC